MLLLMVKEDLCMKAQYYIKTFILVVMISCFFNDECFAKNKKTKEKITKVEKKEETIEVKKPGEIIIGKCSTYHNTYNSAINPKLRKYYVAMRWDYQSLIKHWDIKRTKNKSETKLVKEKLARCQVKITKYDSKTNKKIVKYGKPADYGPAPYTGRVIDLCPKLAKDLKVETDDIVYVTLID